MKKNPKARGLFQAQDDCCTTQPFEEWILKLLAQWKDSEVLSVETKGLDELGGR